MNECIHAYTQTHHYCWSSWSTDPLALLHGSLSGSNFCVPPLSYDTQWTNLVHHATSRVLQDKHPWCVVSSTAPLLRGHFLVVWFATGVRDIRTNGQVVNSESTRPSWCFGVLAWLQDSWEGKPTQGVPRTAAILPCFAFRYVFMLYQTRVFFDEQLRDLCSCLA